MGLIAERQGLSRKHLHTLLTALKTAGLVKSVLGPGGGFILSRPPDQIRISDILTAMEGPFSLVHCVSDAQACERADQCAARGVWQTLSETIEGLLDNATLQDLVGSDGTVCSGPQAKTQEQHGPS